MEPQFWINSWEGGSRTNFHRPDIHPYLPSTSRPDFDRQTRPHATVWQDGRPIVVQTTHRPRRRCRALQAGSPAVLRRAGDLPCAERRPIRGRPVDVDCRDIFTLEPDEIGPIEFVYDRAALVALPLPMRLRYVAKIDELTPRGAVQFVNTVHYHPVLDTPPFSIGPDDIERYHGGRNLIEHVECAARPNHGMVRKFNLDWLVEHGFWLRRISH